MEKESLNLGVVVFLLIIAAFVAVFCGAYSIGFILSGIATILGIYKYYTI